MTEYARNAADRMAARYQRRYTISRHALERFRERVDEEFLSRSDMELGNLLDEKLRHAQEHYAVQDPRAPSATTYLYPLYTRRSGTFYGVVRDGTAVTVLDAEMARNNFGDTWGGVPAPVAKGAAKINTPFAQLPTLLIPPAPPAPVTKAQEPAVPNLYASDDVAAAGARYALALKAQRAATLALERARNAVADAEAEVDAAAQRVAAANQELLRVTGAG